MGMTRQRLDNFKWQFLRLNSNYTRSYATLNRIIRTKKALRDVLIDDFCQVWSISEPVDPSLAVLPKWVRFFHGVLVSKKFSILEMRSKRSSALLYKLMEEKVKYTGGSIRNADKHIVVLSFDTNLLNEKQLIAHIQSQKYFNKSSKRNLADLKQDEIEQLIEIGKYISVKGRATTYGIAKYLQSKGLLNQNRDPVSFKNELDRKIATVSTLIESAPHCVMAD